MLRSIGTFVVGFRHGVGVGVDKREDIAFESGSD